MYWKVSVLFLNVSLHQGSLNLVPFYATVSKNTVSVSDILAVNLNNSWVIFPC